MRSNRSLAAPRKRPCGALLRSTLPLLLWLGALLFPTGQAGAVEIDALVGFGQSAALGSRYRPDSWTPLTVYLTGQGMSGVGQLQVTVKNGDRTTVYTRRVPLREGTLNETQSFVVLTRSPDPWGYRGGSVADIQVQLLREGRKLAEKRVSLPIGTSPETYNVLALTRDGSGMNFLTRKKLGLVHRFYNPTSLSQSQFSPNGTQQKASSVLPLASLQVLYTDPRALPAMAQGYDMVDCVALADLPLDILTEEQMTALQQYVRQGGLLLVSGGGDLSRLKSRFMVEMLPVVPNGIVSARDVPELAQRYVEPLGLQEPVALTSGTLKPEARVLFGGRSGTLPLITARPYGNGIVVFTTFDYLAPEFRGWKAAPALWRDLLRANNTTVSPRNLMETRALTNASPYGTGGGNQLTDALAGKQATSAPAFSTVALFIGAYLFLLIPVNYFVLKKIDKREFAWITVPILILSFTAASYMVALSIKGGMLTVNRAVVLEGQANSDRFAGYAQMTLYSPGRATYDIALGNSNDPNNPYRYAVPSEIFTPGMSNLTGELTIEHDKTAVLRNTLVKLWDKRSFDTPVFADMGGPIEAKTEKVEGRNRVRVTVTNKTRYTLKNCALVNAEGTANLGDLPPGETATQNIRWGEPGSAVAITMPTPSLPSFTYDPTERKNDSPEVSRAKILAGMVQSLSSGANNNYGWNSAYSTYGRKTNAFVGWFYDPILDVSVNGARPKGEEVNLLFVHLPIPEGISHKQRVLYNPFEQKPLLKLEDELPPGARKGGIFK